MPATLARIQVRERAASNNSCKAPGHANPHMEYEGAVASVSVCRLKLPATHNQLLATTSTSGRFCELDSKRL